MMSSKPSSSLGLFDIGRLVVNTVGIGFAILLAAAEVGALTEDLQIDPRETQAYQAYCSQRGATCHDNGLVDLAFLGARYIYVSINNAVVPSHPVDMQLQDWYGRPSQP